MNPKKALIVEDTAANRIFFERLLQHAGFDVTGVETGQDALQKIHESDSWSLALIDMEIPDMSGLELTSRIRKQFPNTCIVIATMHDERSLMQSAFDKGCDIFLVKPYGFMDLFKRLTTEGTARLQESHPFVIDQYGARKFEALASQ
ncbi:MAG: response regulator [Anaerolineae bacterium]|nr:response regulator [Anaerolineae bacterium]MDQ7033647.1 response regulator [Anaerolineae bacterium]